MGRLALYTTYVFLLLLIVCEARRLFFVVFVDLPSYSCLHGLDNVVDCVCVCVCGSNSLHLSINFCCSQTCICFSFNWLSLCVAKSMVWHDGGLSL